MTTSESLDHFHTIVFGVEYMRSLIRKSQTRHSSVDMTVWFSLIPECYRDAVQRLVPNALEGFIGRPLTDESLDRIVATLHQEIWRSVEPISPLTISED